jgi:hypothetical protein
VHIDGEDLENDETYNEEEVDPNSYWDGLEYSADRGQTVVTRDGDDAKQAKTWTCPAFMTKVTMRRTDMKRIMKTMRTKRICSGMLRVWESSILELRLLQRLLNIL